jgi:hypothetical protein
MTRALIAAFLLAATIGLPATASAQPSDSERYRLEQDARLRGLDANDARRTLAELRRLLDEHPPAIRTVLRADPSLLERPDYLAPYPRLAAFLKQHPEVARDPTFFFGRPDYDAYDRRDETPQERAINALQAVLAAVAGFTAVIIILLVLASLVRQAIGHRRWLRQSRVQTEVHSKILDRLQSNEDLLAYIQTPAGQRFLESGPSPQEPERRAIGAPFGRILWSVQAGVMLAALGVGFWLVQRNVMAEIAPAFHALGVLALALGVGAILSAGLSYVLSARLGLLGTSKG